MKNKSLILIIVVLLVGIGLIYIINSQHHFLYSSICGSGFSGIRMFIREYFLVILMIIILLIIIHYRKRKRMCKICSGKYDKDFGVCPYCGIETGEDENRI